MRVEQVKVVFESSSKRYSYFCLKALDVKVGDRVVVEAKDSTCVVTVVEVGPYSDTKMDLKWVLATEKFLKQNIQDVKERWSKVQALRAELDERKRQFEENDVWRMLAQHDSIAANLLKQLKELGE